MALLELSEVIDINVDFFQNGDSNREKITVTPREFKILEFLTKNAQRVISEELLNHGVTGTTPWTWTVDNQMLKLRQKLESNPSNPPHFLTVNGRGYKFLP